MSEKMKISDYKGFELWDTPAPEGWRVHQYPVQVTCNGEHVNCFADAHEAMSVIDGMDADTIAYHMRRAPATAPTAAAQGEGVDAKVIATGLTAFRREGGSITVYREHPGMHEVFVDTLDYTAKIAALEAALQQAQRERDAAVAREKMLLASLHNIRDMRVNPTGDSKYDEGRQMGYQITTELAQAAINAHAKAASAQQAAQPADGEG